MFGFSILDFFLIFTLIAYTVYGFRNGFAVTLGGIIGFALGATAAFFAMPLVSTWVTDSRWRLAAVVLAAIALVVIGNGLGAAVGRKVRSARALRPLRGFDRLAGGVASLVMTALVLSLMSFGLNSLGVPMISQQMASSQVIRFINDATPTPVQGAIAQLRSQVVADGIPKILDAVLPAGEVPNSATAQTPALETASQSVLRITGTAIQCGQNQSGSGFVVAPGRVVTNAHVVAGVTEPVVEGRSGAAAQSRVVYFDPQKDLAVLAVDGLSNAPLPLNDNLADGTEAAFQGFPHGGPFQSKPARVEGIAQVTVSDIYGQSHTSDNVYQLAADVEPGNSGGPLLTTDGKVAGVIFAKASTQSGVGFAITMNDLKPVAARAAALTTPISSGQCTRK